MLQVSFVQSTTKDGRRHSAESAFLSPIRNRKNLKILKFSRAVQILIDPKTKEAFGVKYSRRKRYHRAIAKKEIIVSAGGLNSPQLLMLSGIGPKDHLRKLGRTFSKNDQKLLNSYFESLFETKRLVNSNARERGDSPRIYKTTEDSIH